jgi:predicted RNA polymerase sigma factor
MNCTERGAEMAPRCVFQPAWATRAHLLAGGGRPGDAVAAYSRAISLTTEPRLLRYLVRRRARIGEHGRVT